jgi:hypothetical protein
MDNMDESLTRSSVERYIEIPASDNGIPGSYSLDVLGNAFYLIDCTGEISISTDLSPFKTYRKSTGEEFPREQAFRRLEFRNHGAAITIRVWAGWGRYIDRRFEMVESATTARGWDASSQEIPATSHVDFSPPVGNGVIARKSIIVTNLDANENLQLQDTGGHTFLTVFPRTSVTLPISDTLRIANDTGSAIACNVGQILYVEGNLISAS